MENKRKCECCGEMTIDKDSLYDICENCGWESDQMQEENPNYEGGANKMSLNQAKKAYAEGRKIQ